MNSPAIDLKYNNPPFHYSPGAKTLTVLLHAFWSTRDQMADLIKVVEKTYGKDNVDIYAPSLPYSHPLDRAGADNIVVNLVADFDKNKVVFIGHSLGGVQLRRAFLAGSLNPPDYSGNKFSTRDDLWDAIAKQEQSSSLRMGETRRAFRAARYLGQGLEHFRPHRMAVFDWLNALGLWGRLLEFGEIFGIEEGTPGRAMLDMRKGAMGAFIMPWIRRQKVEWFMYMYVEVKARFPRATMHFVGHSNGTYLASSALNRYPAARFGNIYFAGSVVNPKFDWVEKVDKERVKKFHNARGGEDWVVALLPKSLEYFSDLGGGGFDGFECSAEDTEKITRSDKFAKGGHSGAIEEPHWPEIAKFIVFGDKPFRGNEKTGEGELFMERRVGWMKVFSDLRIGVPLGFSIAALVVLLVFSMWLPSGYWRWSAFHPFGEWGWWLWIGALAAFLVLNFVVKPAPDGTNPAPKGWRATAMTVLFVFCAIGVANFILTSLAREAAQFGWLDPQKHWVAFDASGAAFTLVVMVAGVRFVLTRF